MNTELQMPPIPPEGKWFKNVRLAEKGRNEPDHYEVMAVDAFVGGEAARRRLAEDAKELPPLEFYSRVALVCTDLSNRGYENQAEQLTKVMRAIAWEKWGWKKPDRQEVLNGFYDGEIIGRWQIAGVTFGGKKSLMEAAAGELNRETRYWIEWQGDKGQFEPSSPKFDALCRIASLQRFEGQDRTLGAGNVNFNEGEVKILEQIGEGRRRQTTEEVYEGMSTGQEFLIKIAMINSGENFKKLYQEAWGKLSEVARREVKFSNAEAAWAWAKETLGLKEEFHLWSDEEVAAERQKQAAKPSPASEPPVEEEIPDWLKRLQAEDAAVQAAAREPEKEPPVEEAPAELQIKLTAEDKWASQAVEVSEDIGGGVRINPNQPEFPSKWKKSERQYERQGEIAVIKAGDKKVELIMVDTGPEVTGQPKEVENQMSYWFELGFGYEVRAEAVKTWFRQVQLLPFLQENDPKWKEAKIESGAQADSFILRIGKMKYHVCVPANSAKVKVSWFATSGKSNYNSSEFPPDLLFNDLCAMTEVYANQWLGKNMPPRDENQLTAEKPKMPPMRKKL